MTGRILAVDKNVEVSNREQAAWRSIGFDSVRVDTMCEATDMLGTTRYTFIVINADNIHYLPMLSLIRDVASAPIFVISSDFSSDGLTEALLRGADRYIPFQNVSMDNVSLALTLLQRCMRRSKQPDMQGRHLYNSKLLLSPASRRVFCDDKEINLTFKEFELLRLLMDEPGHVLDYEIIYSNVWKARYTDSSKEVLRTHVRKLRKKLRLDPSLPAYIKTVNDYGYSFDPQYFDTQ